MPDALELEIRGHMADGDAAEAALAAARERVTAHGGSFSRERGADSACVLHGRLPARRPVLEVFALAACAVSLACGARLSLRLGVPAVAAFALSLAIAGGSIVPALLLTVAPWAAGRLVRSRGQLIGNSPSATGLSRPSRPPSPSSPCSASARGSPVSCTTSSPTISP